MKIAFAGTSEFAVPFLDALMHSPHQMLAVYTRPDKPAGRGLKVVASPVKERALAYNLPVYQPMRMGNTDVQKQLTNLELDALVVVSFSSLIPPKVLSIPNFGCINVHPSLLPRWRGASPIQHAILAGDAVTGVTIMQLDIGLDTGDILQQTTVPIASYDTAASLSTKLITVGTELLLDTLHKIERHDVASRPQCGEPSSEDISALISAQLPGASTITMADKIRKEHALIDWSLSAAHIERMIRAFNPWPIAYGKIGGNTVRLWDALALEESVDVVTATDRSGCVALVDREPGMIVNVSKGGIDVETGGGILRIMKMQLPGKKVLTASEVLNGHADLFSKGKMFSSV